MANPETTTPAAGDIVTPKECRDQFRQLDTAEDPILSLYIPAATKYLETWLRRAFLVRTLTFYLDKFPTDVTLRLPRPPLIEVDSVKHLDTDGVLQTLVAVTDYQVDAISEPARIRPAQDKSWPAVQATTYNTVRVQYTAGYATVDAVPAEYKMLVKWIVALWYRNREPSAPVELKDVPHTVTDHIDQWKAWRVEAILGADAERTL